MSDWPIEEIPDKDRLYRGVHRQYIGDSIEPGAFRDDRMSVDWARYSTPQEARARRKRPEDNAVVQLVAGQVRSLPSQHVEHTPIAENRSHSEVIGEKTPRVRVELSRICTIVIPLDQSPA